MNRALLTLLIVSATAGLAAQDADPGSIESVTVFENRARVVRRVPAALASGMNRIEVPELPISLIANSVLAEVDGVSARVLGVRLDRTVHERDIRAEVRDLEDEMRTLLVVETTALAEVEVSGKKRLLTHRFGAILRQAFLERSTRAAAGETEPLLAAEEWISAQVLSAEDRAAELEHDIAELRRRRSEIAENLARVRAGARRVTYTLVVQIEASADGEATLAVGYDVAAARWRPVYEARLDESTREVTWNYGAEIEQKSGEDWDGVALTLSTQRSSLGLAPPTLVPMRVSGYSRSNNRQVTVDGRAAGGLSRDPATSVGDAASGGEDLSRAAIEDSGAVARFVIPVAAKIPTDGRPHRVPILEEKIPAELAFECIPRIRPHTFRRGELENRTAAPFLPGRVKVFREGAYVGETSLEAVPPGGRFRLSFGVEGRLVVHRTEITDREREVGSFRKSDRRILGWTITLRSALEEGAELVLVDRVPVSEIEGLVVALTDSTDPRPEVDADGICRWRVMLSPGEQKEVTFEYQVSAPKGMEIPMRMVD